MGAGSRTLSVEELRPARERGSRPVEAARTNSRHAQRARVELAPRDAAGILDLGLEGLIARIGPCLALSVLIYLLASLLVRSQSLYWKIDYLRLSASFLFPLAATGVVVSLVGDALEDSTRPLGPAIRRGLYSAPATIVLLVLTNFATVPLMALCFVPYFLVLCRTWAAVPLYVLEGEQLLDAAERARGRRNPLARLANIPRRMGRALSRSWRLSRGTPALGRWVLLAIVGQLVLCGLLDAGSGALSYPQAQEFLQGELGLGADAIELLTRLVAALFLGLSGCVRAALMVAYALDLRVRREGRDLELWLERAEHELGSAGAR
ncbi:MAG: hypothetical protein EXS08_02240 [Planctomycetes bacterium]|nr:hypothetical protein [Planctomycetota bacterium]